MKTAYEYNKEVIKTVRPTMNYKGGDLELWKTEARAKLSELLGMDRFTKVEAATLVEYEKNGADFDETRFTFQSESGYRVPCHLLMPKGAKKPPVIICLQGHSTGMHISLGRPKYPGDAELIGGGDRDFCIRAVKEGFAAIAMEQRNFGECGGDENGTHCYESAMTALLSGRTTIGERVWDISRLIDVIQSDFSHSLDTEKICCMGNSGGGTATVYAAALDDRIVLAMPSCAMCTFADSIGAMHHCTCNYVPHMAEFFDMGDLMAMAYPKYFVQVSGVEDDIFPINGAQLVFESGCAAYASKDAQDRCVLVKGKGGHRFYADDAWPVVHKLLSE